MKILFALFLSVSFLSMTLAQTENVPREFLKVELPEAGSYIVMVSASESCSPRDFVLTPNKMMTKKEGTKILASISNKPSDKPKPPSCEEGSHKIRGLIEVDERTELILMGKEENARFFSREVQISVTKIDLE